MAKIISFLSGKGGTGKSTMVSSLAVSLARLGCKALAVDFDIGLRSLDLLLGLENQLVYDLGDVLEDRCPLGDAIVAHPHEPGLRLLCGPTGAAERLELPAVAKLLREAAQSCDYLLLDLPAGLGLGVLLTRELADLAVLVTVPELVTLRDSRKTADELLSGRRGSCRLIINRVARETLVAGGVRDLDEVLDRVGLPLLGAVPLDPYVNSAAPPSRQDLRRAPHSKQDLRRAPLTQKVFDAIARRIAGEYVPILLQWV